MSAVRNRYNRIETNAERLTRLYDHEVVEHGAGCDECAFGPGCETGLRLKDRERAMRLRAGGER